MVFLNNRKSTLRRILLIKLLLYFHFIRKQILTESRSPLNDIQQMEILHWICIGIGGGCLFSLHEVGEHVNRKRKHNCRILLRWNSVQRLRKSKVKMFVHLVGKIRFRKARQIYSDGNSQVCQKCKPFMSLLFSKVNQATYQSEGFLGNR